MASTKREASPDADGDNSVDICSKKVKEDINQKQQQQQQLDKGNVAKNNNNTNNNNNSNNSNNRSTRRVYVANIPFDVKWSELKDLFREKIGNVTYCTIFDNEEGKSRGCGLVEFSDPASAKRAIEMLHRSEYKNRELVVKEDADCERDRYGRIVTNTNNRSRDDSQRRDGNSNMPNAAASGVVNQRRPMQQQPHGNIADAYGYDHSVMSNAFGAQQHLNTYGLSQQFLDSLGINLPLNNRIFVANLEYKVDQSKLEEIFKLSGRVARVKLAHDPQGQSRGYGTVEYEHPVEAVQAISMFNNQKLFGRTMSVRMDKYECEDDNEALPSKLPTGLESIGKGLGVGGQPLNINRSIMNATLVAPPMHAMPSVAQPIPQMGQVVMPGQMPQQHAAVPPAMQQTIQQQLQQQYQQQPSIQQPSIQQPTSMAQASIQQSTLQQQQAAAMQAQPSLAQQQQIQQQLQSLGTMPSYPQMLAARPPVGMYQPQQASAQPGVVQQQQAQQQQQQQPRAPPQAQQNPTSNLSVFSTFERQFREAQSNCSRE